MIFVVTFIGVGLVILLYSRGVLPIAGPFVAMILGPGCVFLGLLWRRRRPIRLSRGLVGELDLLQPGRPCSSWRTVRHESGETGRR